MFGSPLSSPGHDDNDDDEGGGCLSSHYFNLLLQEDNDNADDVDKDKDDVCDVDFIYMDITFRPVSVRTAQFGFIMNRGCI